MGERLGTNRGFELNSFDQFTTAENGSGAWSVASSSPVLGTYSAVITSGNVGDEAWTASIITDKVSCGSDATVVASVDHRHISALNNSNTFSSRSITINLRFYDAGNSLIDSYEIDSWTAGLGSDAGSWTTSSGTTRSPVGTASVALQVNYSINAVEANGWNTVERVDNFSINIPAGGPQVIWWL